MTVTTVTTADELLQLPDDGWRYELVRGELQKMSPTGNRHGEVEVEILFSLTGFVKQHRLGQVYPSDSGFRIARNPDTVRCPDVAFVRSERVVRTVKFNEGPPDVAFEVISPSDRYTDVEEKTREWLRAGVRAVVVVDPENNTVRIHRPGAVETVTDAIEVADILPGWRLPLAELFA